MDDMDEARARMADAGLTPLLQLVGHCLGLPSLATSTKRCRPDSWKVPAEVDRATCLRLVMTTSSACWPKLPFCALLAPPKSPAAVSVLASRPIWMLVNSASPW